MSFPTNETIASVSSQECALLAYRRDVRSFSTEGDILHKFKVHPSRFIINRSVRTLAVADGGLFGSHLRPKRTE